MITKVFQTERRKKKKTVGNSPIMYYVREELSIMFDYEYTWYVYSALTKTDLEKYSLE